MGFLDRVEDFFFGKLPPAPGPEPGERALAERGLDNWGDFPALSTQLAALRTGRSSSAWRVSSIRDALSSPAIFRAVLMISNTVGSLSLNAYRDGARLGDADRPSLIKRPNPLTIPREFGRTLAFDMASTGEAWVWVAKRDSDDMALSLVPVPPREVTVSENPDDPRFPILEWRGRRWPNRDLRQIVLTRLSGDLRGSGPLQLCGAAVSIAIEAQDFAANFFATGGTPSIIVKSAIPLGADPDADPNDEDALTEAELLAADWMSKPHNLPRVIDPTIEDVKALDFNGNGAQMLESRQHSNGDAARMFGIPGSLLDANAPGSSLTYSNVQMELDKWIRVSLAPDYLEPIEQELSDLLVRNTITRFNVEGLLRADPKTRAEVYSTLVPLQIMTTEEARANEGLAPGSIETAPVPQSPPAAMPPIVERAVPEVVRCAAKVVRRGLLTECGRKLGELVEPYSVQCPRCGALAVAPGPEPEPMQPLELVAAV